MIRESDGMFGGGMYFAETKQAANHKALHSGYVIHADVFVGKELRVKDYTAGKFSFTKLWRMGYDSVWAPNGCGTGECERVVYNNDQVRIVDIKPYQ